LSLGQAWERGSEKGKAAEKPGNQYLAADVFLFVKDARFDHLPVSERETISRGFTSF
jgi:hypothetical protein